MRNSKSEMRNYATDNMYLCIDTITTESGIALVHNNKAIFVPLESRRSSDGMFVALDEIFKKAKAKPADIKGVVVVRGPGSFTSVRVGIAVANQIAHQLSIPIIGLTTDEWYRFKIDEPKSVYLQTMNRDEVYSDGRIIRFSDLPRKPKIKWLGQLSADHLAALPPNYQLIEGQKKITDTWLAVCASVFPVTQKRKAYELIEPYYGKEAKITPRRRD
jgi:tRNA threonylcarbamoyl adenosine modification protein YeaZ